MAVTMRVAGPPASIADAVEGTISMARITGIGGVFFRSDDSDRLYSWYDKHLGIQRDPNMGGSVCFPWQQVGDPAASRMTVWSIFPRDTPYFGPSHPTFMVNYIVDDIDGMVESLLASGAEVDPRREDTPYGRFAWVTDPEGNRIELWEPPGMEVQIEERASKTRESSLSLGPSFIR